MPCTPPPMTFGDKLNTVIAIFIFLTLLVYFFQLMVMRSSSISQQTVELMKYLQSSEIREARTFIMGELVEPVSEKSGKETKEKANLVASSYNMDGILVKQKIVRKDVFLENWGPSIIKCHSNLQSYVENFQRPENAGVNYWKYFGWLSGESQKYLNKAMGKDKSAKPTIPAQIPEG